ncbi:MAG: zinc-binding dehydrogenase [Thermomicrobiales bacterium]|nr:zinc-binding dehydrogenase [Thermomicrobiales bacterium]
MVVTARGAVLKAFNEPLSIETAEISAPGPGAMVVRVTHGGVCGTDVHLHHGNLKIPTPVILGHEGIGTIEQLGEGVTADFDGNPLNVGDTVAWMSSIPCGHCYWCAIEHEPTLCETRRVYGINQAFEVWPHLSGSWADAIYLQPGSTIFKLPEGVNPIQAIALGCAAPTAVHGVLDIMRIGFGDTVVVQGAGPVGLAAAMYAHFSGASKVIVVGGPASRLEIAREIGVGDLHLDIFDGTTPADRLERILDETAGRRGADVVLECTGVPTAVAEGLDMVRKNGQYLVLGQYTDRGETPINPHVITRKQLHVHGSWTFGPSQYARYIATLPELAKRFDLEKLVTTYPLAEANQALSDMAAGKVMKAVLLAN